MTNNNDSFVNWLNSMPKHGLKAVKTYRGKTDRYKVEIEFNTGNGIILSNYIMGEVKFQFTKEQIKMYNDNPELIVISDLASYRVRKAMIDKSKANEFNCPHECHIKGVFECKNCIAHLKPCFLGEFPKEEAAAQE